MTLHVQDAGGGGGRKIVFGYKRVQFADLSITFLNEYHARLPVAQHAGMHTKFVHILG